LLRDEKLAARSVVLIGETGIERDWMTAGKLAGFVQGEAYFPTPA